MSNILKECESLPERRFSKGESVIEQGDRTGVLYILAEGCVEIVKNEFQIDTIDSPGSIFGEISVLLDLPHMASVRAIEPTRFLVADHPTEFLRRHPEVHLHLSRLLAKRLNGVTSYLVDVKRQFEGQQDHMGMVDEVLECLIHNQPDDPDADSA